MAQIETWYNQDLQQPVRVHYLDGSLFSHNSNGNRIGVHVFNNGEPVTLSGTVSGYVVTADGSTVPCTGTRSGNSASILIPAAAYQPGAVFITLFITDGTTVTTLASVSTSVLTARTNNQIDPGSVVTDWTQTINAAMQSVETAAENLGGIIAVPYANITYPVPLGKYTYYEGNLYRCISPIAASESFTAAHWTQVRLGDDVSDLNFALNATNNRISYNLVRPIVISTNLFDKDSANIGLSILSNGTISSLADWFASAPIFVEGITNIFKSNGHLTFWTKDGTYISGIGVGTNTTTVPQNAEYAILSASVSVLNTAMVNEGTATKPYDNYKAAISQADIYKLSDTFDKYLLMRDAILPDVHSPQLFDKTAITTGYYIDASGKMIAASGWFYSDKIFDEITPGETYTKSGTCTAYDADDNFIQQFANSVTTFVMPANTDYVRMSRGETALDITYLVKGTVVTADLQYYKRYGKNQIDIPQTYIVDINGNGDYTSLTKCVKEHRFENCDIIVRAGTYDLYQEFSDEYGTAFTSGSTVYEGIQVDKHRRFFIDSDAIIKFEYTGSVENIIKYFSPFKFDGIGGEIHGGKIVASNCRYAIHSDVYAYATGKETSLIDGVYVEFNNPARNVIIGGGMGQSSDITVQNCVLKQTADGNPTAIFYHNAETGQAQGRIRITNNYCDNGKIYVQSFGESTKITTALVTGNRCTSVSKVSSSPDNMELLAFNNVTDN